MIRKRALQLVFLLTACITVLAAQDLPSPSPGPQAEPKAPAVSKILSSGIEAFSQERYRTALDFFGAILSDPKAEAERPSAVYWSVLTYLALGDKTAAGKAIDDYLSTYPEGERAPDLLYQRGRLLFAKADYEAALSTFSAFVTASPDHALVPAALYWGGESLYALGRIDDADKVFEALVTKYPASVKVEAANYRRNLIGLERRERELLKLLTWSHEESLRAASDFRDREKSYESSIEAYRKQIEEVKKSAAAQGPELKAKIGELQKKLDQAQADLDATKQALAKAQAQSVSSEAAIAAAKQAAQTQAAVAAQSRETSSLLPEALALKQRALELLAYYLETLAQGAK